MDKKMKYVWAGIVAIALIFAGFLWYQSSARKGEKLLNPLQGTSENETSGSLENAISEDQAADEIMVDEDATDYNAMCENGEWLKIADLSGEISSVAGKLRKVYPDDTPDQFKSYQYYVEGSQSYGITGGSLFKMDYFEDREVEVQGVIGAGKKEIAASQVRCAGKETDKGVLSKRKNLMNWLAANINSVAPQKAKHQKWVVDIVDFVDESNVYVEYYDAVEDDENSDVDEDTSRKILLETSASGAGYNAKVLAYWEMGEDDFTLKSGTDKFEDADTIASYQYDSEKNIWERIN